MATMQGKLAAGRARAVRSGRMPRMAAAAASLGLAAVLAFGGLRAYEAARPVPATVPAEQQPGTVLDWEQVERGQVAPGQPGAILDWEQQERAQVAP